MLWNAPKGVVSPFFIGQERMSSQCLDLSATHEMLCSPPKLRFQAFERFGSAPNRVHSFGPARCWIVLLSPATHRNQHRQEIESLVGQAVDGLLGMSRIIAPRDDAVLDQRVEPVRQHIARDSFFGRGSGRARPMRSFAELDAYAL